MTFDESLSVPGIGFPAHSAYGVVQPADCKNCYDDYCDKPWTVQARTQWVNALRTAQAQIERRLKRPLCPSEVCERHRLECPIRLRGPISYLGKKVCSAPFVVEISYPKRSLPCNMTPEEKMACHTCMSCADSEVAAATIAKDSIPAPYTIYDLEFSYDKANCPPSTPMTPAFPCVIERDTEWLLVWRKYQLFGPTSEPSRLDEACSFVTCLNASLCVVDETLAIVPIEQCDCGCQKKCYCGCAPCSCGGSNSPFEVTIGDAEGGVICIKPNGNCNVKHVYVNYATAQPCGDVRDDMVEAVVKLAASKILPTSHVCSCDRMTEIVERWTESDPTSAQSFAKDIMFGSERGAMVAQRFVQSARATTVNGNTTTGGFFSARRGVASSENPYR